MEEALKLVFVALKESHSIGRQTKKTGQHRPGNRIAPIRSLIRDAKEGDKVISNRVAPFDFRSKLTSHQGGEAR